MNTNAALLVALAACALLGGVQAAETPRTRSEPTWPHYQPRNWTNAPSSDWTNTPTRLAPPSVWTNAPTAGNSNYSVKVVPPAHMQPGARNPTTQKLPADVQTLIKQFQQNREQLALQLNNATGEQRAQILRDLERLRTQMREQLNAVREDARRQADNMQGRFGNPRDRLLQQGAGSGTSGDNNGTSGRPRP